MLYAQHESRKPGSDYTVIHNDLKTVRGVQNRIMRGQYYLPGIWYIYRCSREAWFKDTGHVLVGRVKKGTQ